MTISGTPEYIFLNILGQDNTVFRYPIKKHNRLKKLMEGYCEMNGLEKWSTRFLFKGYRIYEDDTPFSLGIEEGDGDTIEVFQQQIGGSFYSNFY